MFNTELCSTHSPTMYKFMPSSGILLVSYTNKPLVSLIAGCMHAVGIEASRTTAGAYKLGKKQEVQLMAKKPWIEGCARIRF